MSNIANSTDTPRTTEVLIIGGSFSGMAAAMTLGRALRQVILVDSGLPCNRFATHAHNILGSDGLPPMEIHAQARKQLLHYPTIELIEDQVTNASRDDQGFSVQTSSGKQFKAQKLLLATGLTDELPEIAGLEACWGKSVIPCPYCHGYEFKGQKTGLLASNANALHMVSLLKQWTNDLQVFTHDGFVFDETALNYLQEQSVELVKGNVLSVNHHQGQLSGIQLEKPDGEVITPALDVLYIMPKTRQSLDLQSQLGYQLTPEGHIQVDEMRHTTVPGLYAAGDNSTNFRALSPAMASGMAAGAIINGDLINEKRPLPKMQ